VERALAAVLARAGLCAGLCAGLSPEAAAQGATFSTRVTNNNRVGLTTTNYGFFGNDFVSRSPSFEYPLGEDYEHMVRAGLWIGAKTFSQIGDTTRVTTGAVDGFQGNGGPSSTEYLPVTGISERSRLQNSRFYDPKAVSEQDYVAVYSDDPGRTPTSAVESHYALGLEVTQEFYNWSFSVFADVLIAHLTIKATRALLRDTYVGLFSELASGDKSAYSTWPPSSTGSVLGSWYSKKLLRWDPSRRLLAEHYCRDYTGGEGTCGFDICPPWVGVVLLGTRPDTIAIKQVGLQFWNFAPGDASRDQDIEMYALLSSPHQTPADSLLPLAGLNDPVELLSVGPFNLSVDETTAVDFAFVGGLTYDDLLEAADFAQLAFDFNYVVPTPPPSPRLKLVASAGVADIYWDNSPESAADETSPQPGGIDFQGYRVYLGEDRSDPNLIAQYDIVDTTLFNTGFDAIRLAQPVVIDGDTMHYRYRVTGLPDGFKRFAAVTSFDTGDQQVPPLESGITQNKAEVIPALAPGERSDLSVTVFPNPYKVDAMWDAGSLARDHYLWFANLPRRCRLSIFTLAGDLVFETDFDGDSYDGSNARGVYDPTQELDIPPPFLSGGTFGWDMISREGQAVASGLYLFSVRDSDSGEVQRGKFLILKSDREGGS
jgi:hypothetical protein